MLAQNLKETLLGDPQDKNSDSNHLSSNQENQLCGDLPENDLANKKVGKWTPEEDELLRKYVPMYGEKQWRKISEYISGRTSIQCLHRWTKILKPGLVKGPWTAEEDQKLKTWVKTEGPTKWAQCANFIKGRSGKQCRERWFNNLNPEVKKGNWAKEEDELIFKLYQKYGSSWSKIAKFVPGRTENAIKNRFYSTLRKLAADKKKIQTEQYEEGSMRRDDVEAEETHSNMLSIPPTIQPLNTLYALLHDKTSAVQNNEETKKEKEAIHSKETKHDEKKQMLFNFNGGKVIVARDNKISEGHIQEATASLMNAKIEDNDIAFEEFLTSLHNNLNEDFLTKEFEHNKKVDDISHLDNLQRKILDFCQTNIKDLAETFKRIEPKKASNNASERSPSEAKPKTASQPQGASVTVNRPETNTQQDASFLRGTTILIPKPDNQKGAGLSNPQINNLHGITSKKSSHNNSVGSSGKKNLGIKSEDNNETSENLNESKILSNNSQAGYFSHKIPAMQKEETEKRLTFLFQQLYALEALLSKTRNNLIHFESSMNQKERKSSNQENMNVKIEDTTDINSTDQARQVRKQKSVDQLNSEFEQIMKKKKVE